MKPKRHPKTHQIIKEMDRWAKKKYWPPNLTEVVLNIEEVIDYAISVFELDWGAVCMNNKMIQDFGQVLHFMPGGCRGGAVYVRCARPGTGKVVRHKIGNCPLAKERQ